MMNDEAAKQNEATSVVKPVRTPKAAKKKAVAKKPASKVLAKKIASKPAKKAATPVQKPSVRAKPKKVAKAAKPVKPAKTEKLVKPSKAPKTQKTKKVKIKMVRDGYTMPENEYIAFEDIKKKCLAAGIHVKKGEILRAALRMLAHLPSLEIVNAISQIEKLKTGRPSAGE